MSVWLLLCWAAAPPWPLWIVSRCPWEIRRLLPTRRGEWIGVGSLGVARWEARGRCRGHFEWEQPQELLQATLDAEGKQISCYYDRRCLTYAIETGKEISRREFDLRRSFEVQPGGRALAVCEHQDAELRDPRTGKLLHGFDDHPGRVYRVGLSADQQTLVVVWRRDSQSRERTGVSVWDVATGKCRYTFFPRSSETVCAIAPAGDLVAINEGSYVGLYSIPSGEPLYGWPCDARHRLEFSPDGRYLAALGQNLAVWRLRDHPR
jgi:WD40 repeat protein